jgi:hypothetical protein
MKQGLGKTPLSVKGQRKLYSIKGDTMNSLIKRYYDLAIVISIVVLINICLYGCGGMGKTAVLMPNNIHKNYSSVTILEGNSTVYVPPEIKDLFEGTLNNILIEDGKFKRGAGLKIIYSYIQFNPGYQAAHHLIMGGMGEGSITVNVIYIDPSGNEISNIQTEGIISIGYPINVAIEECARRIALYTEEKFLNKGTNILIDNNAKHLKTPDKEINSDMKNGKDKMKGWWEPAK